MFHLAGGPLPKCVLAPTVELSQYLLPLDTVTQRWEDKVPALKEPDRWYAKMQVNKRCDEHQERNKQGDKVMDKVRGGGHHAQAKTQRVRRWEAQKSCGKASRGKPQVQSPWGTERGQRARRIESRPVWLEFGKSGRPVKCEVRGKAVVFVNTLALICAKIGAIGSFFEA